VTLESNARLLATLMRAALPTSAGSNPQLDALVTSAGNDPQGQSALFLNDLTQCSLQGNKTWSYAHPGHTPPSSTGGSGNLMMLPDDWTTGPLASFSSQTAVTTCLAARVNAYGVPVSIYVAGNQVAPTPSVPIPPYSEALWYASLLQDVAGKPAQLLVEAWPSAQLMNGCINQANLEAAIKLRVCSDTTLCNARIHDKPGPTGDDITHCSKNAKGYYQCSGHDVIETRLGVGAWEAIYQCTGCATPPPCPPGATCL
jgi:hypothetical protein